MNSLYEQRVARAVANLAAELGVDLTGSDPIVVDGITFKVTRNRGLATEWEAYRDGVKVGDVKVTLAYDGLSFNSSRYVVSGPCVPASRTITNGNPRVKTLTKAESAAKAIRLYLRAPTTLEADIQAATEELAAAKRHRQESEWRLQAATRVAGDALCKWALSLAPKEVPSAIAETVWTLRERAVIAADADVIQQAKEKKLADLKAEAT